MLIRKTLSNEQSKVIKDLMVRWVCSDNRPFSIIDDNGLRALIQECVKLGSIYGNIDVNDILRGRTIISAHLQVVAKSCRERIKESLQEPYKNRSIRDLHPITCYGHRLNNVLKRSFFQHQKQLPTLSATSIEKPSTSDEEDDDDSFYIPSKPVKANKKLNIYTNVVKEQMMITKLIDPPPAVQLLIKSIVECKSLAKYIKKAGLNKEIEGAGGVAIQQAILIRWISLINLLESINASFIQIKVVLIPRKQYQRISGINQYLVKQTIRLLKPFKAIIKMIQSGSNPTLYLVLPCTLSLQKALKSFDNLLQHIGKYEGQELNDNYNDEQEDEGVSYIRQRILTLLHDMIDLDIRHYCATLLHPDYRSLKGCTNDERVECHNYNKPLKSEHSSILDDFKDDANTYDDECDDDYDTRSVEYSLLMSQSDELSRYLSMKIDMKHYRSDVLTFWKSNTDELPHLSQVARQIHSIPATSAGIERQFSIAGLTLTNRRTYLDPEQLDNVLCIRTVAKLNSQM
ncbi:unnamed protein product [Rotaria sp. Silwood2]|nr:unnamed protein product [Rotaria sp. Silwood2]